MNLALPSLHGGSLEITLTVPLRERKKEKMVKKRVKLKKKKKGLSVKKKNR